MTNVSVSRAHYPVTTLGPGRRVGVWFQGCSIHCPGCISVDTWAPSAGVPVEALVATLSEWADVADGLTISGGEPFDQPVALAALLSEWRALSEGSILVFTGYEFAEVEHWLAAYSGLIDALMTGPFRSDLPQTKALRGSDNQTLHVLTPGGAQFEAFERPASSEDLRLDAMLDDDGQVWLAGIPARGDLGRLRRVLARQGHRVTTSDQVILP